MSTSTRSILADRGPVSLGCGTLILIALIVLIFSNRPEPNTSELKSDIQRLQTAVGVLESVINKQTAEISQLEQQIRRHVEKQNQPLQPEKPNKE